MVVYSSVTVLFHLDEVLRNSPCCGIYQNFPFHYIDFYVCACAQGGVICLCSSLSFHHVGPRNPAQVFRLDCKHFFLSTTLSPRPLGLSLLLLLSSSSVLDVLLEDSPRPSGIHITESGIFWWKLYSKPPPPSLYEPQRCTKPLPQGI